MVRFFERAKSKARNIYKVTAGESSSTTSRILSTGPTQPAPGTTTQPPPDAPRTNEIEPLSLHRLQEKIWGQAYDNLRLKEPKIVQAFEIVVSVELERGEPSFESADQPECEPTTDGAVRSHQMLHLVRNGLDRTRKVTAVKQEIDDSLQAVHAIRGIMDRAAHAAPEAAVVWATVCLGLEVLSNPVTEALENRKGIQYVLSRMEWYWKLVDLLLDENKGEASTAALRDELGQDIIRLFEKLLLYQISSICLYHRNGAAVVGRDMLRIDDWAGQLGSIKEMEGAVQRDVEQYNTQQANIRLQKLNFTASALESNLQNIFAALQDQKEHQTKRDEEDKDKKCLRDLRVTDPRMDKKEIEERKGGLLRDSYAWICDHADFQRFRNDEASRLLWIRGDPGKGKTMLLCGIIDELERDSSVSLFYFFCQATGGDRVSTATSVLRGLIFDIARHNRQLTKYVRKKYDYAGRELFSGVNAWQDLSEILSSMLQDPSLVNTVLVVDALDECSVDRVRLVDFISRPSPAKWIVSSRNWLYIEESLGGAEQKVNLQLELNQDSISKAVDFYIKYKTDQLAQKKNYDAQMKDAVLRYLMTNANGTFLWVALVCQELTKPNVRRRHTFDTLKSFPPGLVPLYERMLSEISHSRDATLCKEILAITLVAYRPTTLEELKVLVAGLGDLNKEEIEEVISSCGSFLTLQSGYVSFVHQSAKDYLLEAGSCMVVPRGVPRQHRVVFSKSLELLSTTLHRNMYALQTPGYPIDQVSAPENDPLVAIRYPCVYWVHHLSEWVSGIDTRDEMLDPTGSISTFLRKKYLYWLEALSLLRSIASGVKAMEILEHLLVSTLGIFKQEDRNSFQQQKTGMQHLRDIVIDARRFLLAHKRVIEIAPLQTYISALVFSPTNSIIRQSFCLEEPDWMTLKPGVEADWSACLQTLEGHYDEVTSVVFSSDSQRLASGSRDRTINVWDANAGTCLQTLRGHTLAVTSVIFSNDGQWLVSGSEDSTIKIWDVTSGICLQTFEGHDNAVLSVVFSSDDRRLASGSTDSTVKIWDVTSGVCLQTLEGHAQRVWSVAFSNNGQRLASGAEDKTIKIWDTASGRCIQTLAGHEAFVMSVDLSSDGQRLASASGDKTIKIWDTTSGRCIQNLTGHESFVTSVKLSSDGQRLASGSDDRTIKIWDSTSWKCIRTLEGHDSRVTSIAFSADGQRLASGSLDRTVKIWDATPGAGLQTLEGHNSTVGSLVLSTDGRRLAFRSPDYTIRTWDAASGVYIQTLEGHRRGVACLAFSSDAQRLASGSYDHTVKIWDPASGTCLQTLEGHDRGVHSVIFSNDDRRLASGSSDKTIKIWDAASGIRLQTLEGHDHLLTSLVFSNDGQLLASGSSWPHGVAIKIWDVASGVCLRTLEGHDHGVASVVFSSDAQRLASGSADQTVKIWDVNLGVCVQTLSVGCTMYRLSFDPTNDSCLFTNRGALHLKSPAGTPLGNHVSLHLPKFDGFGISADHEWIVQDDRNLLWLPPGYRARAASAVAGSRIVLACGSRRVLVIELRRTGNSPNHGTH